MCRVDEIEVGQEVEFLYRGYEMNSYSQRVEVRSSIKAIYTGQEFIVTEGRDVNKIRNQIFERATEEYTRESIITIGFATSDRIVAINPL